MSPAIKDCYPVTLLDKYLYQDLSKITKTITNKLVLVHTGIPKQGKILI